jgi:alpha-1,6-mannosyltransferase
VSARTAPSRLVPLAGLLLATTAAGLAAQFSEKVQLFVIIVLVQGAVWAAAAVVVRRDHGPRPALTLILGTAVLLRVIALAAPVFLSDDINRYIWDGRVQAAGMNPYRYLPVDPELAPLRDDVIYPNINRMNYAPTIYPPVAQMIFLLANRLGETVLAMKLVLVAFEAIGVCGLLAVLRATGSPQENILLYAWHPLPVWEIAGSGHIDAAIVAFVALALVAALGGRRGWSGAALGAATLVKFVPLVLAPAVWRPTRTNSVDWRWPAAFVATICLGYLPFIGVGSRVLGFLPGYVSEENLTSGTGFWLVRALHIPVTAYLPLAAVILAAIAVGALRRRADPVSSLPWAAALGTAATVLASPHYAWYFVWLIALLCVAPRWQSWWPAWWPSLTAALLYWDPPGRPSFWVGLIIYGGFAVLCVIALVSRLVLSLCRPAEIAKSRTVSPQ